jgi:RsiW-degrading membrane proteinase PrsW (M82 family)
MVPMMVFWGRQGRILDPKLGLCLGAAAGAGFGIFEANWAHGLTLTAGWNWQTVSDYGLIALAPFWERLFAVAFHISASALVGYGLAKGWGWQFYLIASLFHGILNYVTILLQSGMMSLIEVEIFIAVWSVVITIGVLWLRWERIHPAAESTGESNTAEDSKTSAFS